MNNIIFKMKFMIITKKINNTILEKEKKEKNKNLFFNVKTKRIGRFYWKKRGKIKKMKKRKNRTC